MRVLQHSNPCGTRMFPVPRRDTVHGGEFDVGT
jgi:hypothetical protein